MTANIELMFSNSRNEVQGHMREQDQRIDNIREDVQAMQKSIENITETLKVDQSIEGIRQSEGPTPAAQGQTRSELAFERKRPATANAPTPRQDTRSVEHKPDYASADPRRPLTRRAHLPQGYRTIEWFNFDNLHVESPYTVRASEGSLATAKKIKASDVPFFGTTLIDDWIDDFEDWCETQFGSP
ncbi:hypothetical protein BG005_005438, partial [Podila minutissima]